MVAVVLERFASLRPFLYHLTADSHLTAIMSSRVMKKGILGPNGLIMYRTQIQDFPA